VPDRVDPDRADALVAAVRERRELTLLGRRTIPFDEARDLLFLQRERLPDHSNGMRFTAFDAAGGRLHEAVYYSVGGGFVVDEAEMRADERPTANVSLPYPFRTAEDL
jgi:L-serine dehydratase